MLAVGRGLPRSIDLYGVFLGFGWGSCEGCLENVSRCGRYHRFEMHPISQMLDPPGQPIHGRVPPPFVKIVRPRFMVGDIAGEHRKDTLHDRVRDGDEGRLFPTAGCEALLQRRYIRPLRAYGSMNELCQDGP